MIHFCQECAFIDLHVNNLHHRCHHPLFEGHEKELFVRADSPACNWFRNKEVCGKCEHLLFVRIGRIPYGFYCELSPLGERLDQLTIPMKDPADKKCENYKEKRDGHVW
jgi:hypothetical protein